MVSHQQTALPRVQYTDESWLGLLRQDAHPRRRSSRHRQSRPDTASAASFPKSKSKQKRKPPTCKPRSHSHCTSPAKQPPLSSSSSYCWFMFRPFLSDFRPLRQDGHTTTTEARHFGRLALAHPPSSNYDTWPSLHDCVRALTAMAAWLCAHATDQMSRRLPLNSTMSGTSVLARIMMTETERRNMSTCRMAPI
jgi:hypothetical protein